MICISGLERNDMQVCDIRGEASAAEPRASGAREGRPR